MKFYNKQFHLRAWVALALISLSVSSTGVLAGQYQSEVDFPCTYSAGQTHRIYIPYNVVAADGVKIQNVSWSWGGRSNHQSYSVQLCQVATNICKDISYQKNGTSTAFNRTSAAVPFYFLVTGVGRPFNPEWGLSGSLTVNW